MKRWWRTASASNSDAGGEAMAMILDFDIEAIHIFIVESILARQWAGHDSQRVCSKKAINFWS
ncbi:hypothetical protein ULG90_19080 [Halopseudomonas pachastrellae]|nr:hypothetical protein ULG90_19080 [Halopseudomonas pachastrellae]